MTLNNDTIRRAVGLPLLQVQEPIYKLPRPLTVYIVVALRFSVLRAPAVQADSLGLDVDAVD